MTRTLPAQPDLVHLKNEAKALLKAHRRGDPDAVEVLGHLSRFRHATSEEVASDEAVTLLEVQQALAVDYGFESWPALKRHIEDSVPRILGAAPAFVVGDRDVAYEHYVEWLGFTCEWEWRSAPDQPVIMSMRRGEFRFFLGDAGQVGTGSMTHLAVANREALAQEWESRFPGRFPGFDVTSTITDPWGNSLVFEPFDNPADSQDLRDEMRAEVLRLLDQGEDLPSVAALGVLGGDPEERVGTLLDRAGVPWVSPGYIAAADVLNEFPGHADAIRRRRERVFSELGVETVDQDEQSVLVVEEVVPVDDIAARLAELRAQAHHVGKQHRIDADGPDLVVFGNTRGDRPDRQVRLRVGYVTTGRRDGNPSPARIITLPGGKAAAVNLDDAENRTVGYEHVDRTGVTADLHRWDRRAAERWEVLRVYAREAGSTPSGNWAGAGGWQTLPDEANGAATLFLPLRPTVNDE